MYIDGHRRPRHRERPRGTTHYIAAFAAVACAGLGLLLPWAVPRLLYGAGGPGLPGANVERIPAGVAGADPFFVSGVTGAADRGPGAGVLQWAADLLGGARGQAPPPREVFAWLRGRTGAWFRPAPLACDLPRLLEALDAAPDRRRAFARVLGWNPAQLPSHLAGLQAGYLLKETRVVNHGFVRGRGVPRAQILAAGTAVLVDEAAVPRVRCECGNPLLAVEEAPPEKARHHGPAPAEAVSAAPTVPGNVPPEISGRPGLAAEAPLYWLVRPPSDRPVSFADPEDPLQLAAAPAPKAPRLGTIVAGAFAPVAEADPLLDFVRDVSVPVPLPAGAPAPVPLPPAVLLLLAALGVLASGRRR